MTSRVTLGPYPPPFEGVGIVAKTEHDSEGGLFIGATDGPSQAGRGLELIHKGAFASDLHRLLLKIKKNRQKISQISAHFATTYGFVAYVAKKLWKIPYTVTCHGSDILFNLDKWPHKILTRLALENADKIFAVSGAVKKKIEEAGIKNSVKIVRNKPGKQFKPFKKIEKKNQIISVGTVYPNKGFDVLLEAFGKIAPRFPQHELLIVGRIADKAYKKKLSEIIDLYNIGNMVKFLGERTDIPRLLNESKLFVLASRSEGYGLALAEAIACKLECIASNVGGIPEVAGDRKNCTLFESGDVNELATLMERKLVWLG